MPVVRKSIDLPYTPEDMFSLVCDVRSYPDFIGWIKTLDIVHQRSDDQLWQARAKTTVAVAGLIQPFSTDITADRRRLTIDVRLAEGPFSHLRNSWTFMPGPAGTRTNFVIDFQFKSGLLRVLSAVNADRAGQILARRFTQEAARRFGPTARCQRLAASGRAIPLSPGRKAPAPLQRWPRAPRRARSP